MEKILLNPYFDVKPWGGNLLKEIFNTKPNTGEAWLVSAIKNKESTLIDGTPLSSFIKVNYSRLGLKINEEFPVLIKLLDAKENLSIQVHPDNEYAQKKGYTVGKYEIWYVLDENHSKKVIFGLQNVSRNELEKALKNDDILNYLIYKDIHEHDLLKCTPGTVHAVLGSSFFLEVQEPCDITYRLYDYNRLPKRELHIEDGLNSIYKNHSKVDLEKYKILDNGKVIKVFIKNYDKFYFEIQKETYLTYLIIV
jgi:Phosphomannose isomerase